MKKISILFLILFGGCVTVPQKPSKPVQEAAGTPFSAQNKLLQGIRYEKSGNLEMALRSYQECHTASQKFSVCLANEMRILDQTGQQQRARNRIELELLARHKSASLLFALVFYQISLGDLAKAQGTGYELLQSLPGEAHGLYAMAQVFYAQGKWEASVWTLTDTLEAAPNWGAALILLGQALIKQKKYDRAQKVLNQALSQYGEARQVHDALGTLALEKGLLDEALSHFQSANKLEGDGSTFMNLGAVNALLGRTDRAEEQYKKARNSFHKIGNEAFEKGVQRARNGDMEKALTFFKSAKLKKEGNIALIDFNEALLYLDKKGSLQERKIAYLRASKLFASALKYGRFDKPRKHRVRGYLKILREKLELIRLDEGSVKREGT